jgi:hypothetical protein
VARVWLGFDPQLDLQLVQINCFFSNPASGGTFSSTAKEMINRLKLAVVNEKVSPHLVARDVEFRMQNTFLVCQPSVIQKSKE